MLAVTVPATWQGVTVVESWLGMAGDSELDRLIFRVVIGTIKGF